MQQEEDARRSGGSRARTATDDVIDRKRARYNSSFANEATSSTSQEVTPEQMEAYKRKRLLREDPMSQFASKKDEDD